MIRIGYHFFANEHMAKRSNDFSVRLGSVHIWICTFFFFGIIATTAFVAERTERNSWTQETELPNTSIINPGMLSDARERIARGDNVQVQVDTLRARADAVLADRVYTVMDKEIDPPTGDKHDYLSRAPYFWPNPDTPDGLPYIKKDGEIYEPNRSGTDFVSRNKMDHGVIVLSVAYYLLGDERYASGAAERIRAWFLAEETRMNPHLDFAQGVPGIMDGSLWGIIDTWRWSALVDAISLIESSPSWTDADANGMAKWFDQYQQWLRTSELGFDESLMWNNHGSFYDAQVVALSMYAGKREPARAILLEARNRRINHGIEPDGRQLYELERTRSFGYSVFNLRAFFHLAALGDQLDVDLWNYRADDGSGIRQGLDFLAQYADPQIEWPYLDLKFQREVLIPMLRWASYAYNEPAYLEKARMIPGYAEVTAAFPTRVTDIPQLFLEP